MRVHTAVKNDAIETFEIKGLEQLIKALKAQPPKAKLGILGSSARTANGKKGPSNAMIGAAHEFGTTTIEQRSFLRMPLTEELNAELERAGAFDERVMKDVIKQGSVIPWLTKIAIVAKNIVLDAFDTGGFGKWPAWKNPNYENNTGKLLVDTQQLRNSIEYEVSE